MFVRLIAVALIALVAWAVIVRASEGAGRDRSYVVRPGDTLWTIAASRYAGDPRAGVWKIRTRNGLSGSVLQPGQRLVLPTG
jgi:LysM repeat protein